jgi:hypothetical protein
MLLFSIGLECYLQPKTGQTIPYQEDLTLNLRNIIFSPPLLATNSQMTVLMDVSSQRSGTSNLVSQLNLMVDSWTTKHNNNHDSTSIFDENIGEDRLSIRSVYDVNINNPYHTGSLALNIELLDSPSLYDDELKVSYTILTKEINDLQVQLSSNKTLLSVNKQGWTFNTNIAKVRAANIIISINVIELNEWAVNNKVARCWYCRDLCNCSILNIAIKKPYTNNHIMFNKGICFLMKMMDNKFSFGGLCPHTGPAMCWILSTFTVFLSFIPINRQAQLSGAF